MVTLVHGALQQLADLHLHSRSGITSGRDGWTRLPALQVSRLVVCGTVYSEQLGLDPAPESSPIAEVFATSPIPCAIHEPAAYRDAVAHLGWGRGRLVAADGSYRCIMCRA